MYSVFLLIILTIFSIGNTEGKLKKNYPPHCTHVTKDTDYVSRFKLDYPVAYIHPGVRETYQPGSWISRKTPGYSFGILFLAFQEPTTELTITEQMYCLNPPSVNKAVTVVCDWAAPPQVQFTLADDYMHVVRQDPSGRYLGNAIITTYQLCGHNMSHVETLDVDVPIVTNEV